MALEYLGVLPQAAYCYCTVAPPGGQLEAFILGKVIEASGHLSIWPVPRDRESGAETDAERKQRKARAQFVKPFLREQFVRSIDQSTANWIIEASVILVAEFSTKEGISLERAAAAVRDALMDDYAEINNITGASFITTKRDFSTYIKGLKGQSRRGRPPGPSSRSYTKDNFWQEEASARERVAAKKDGKPWNKDIAKEMGIEEWQYYSYRRKYR